MSTSHARLAPAGSATSTQTRSLPSIQALRAIAASLVVFHHFALIYKTTTLSLIYNSGLGLLWRCGVDIFFVISGLIMAYSTRHLIGMSDAWIFIKKRAERILPLYWLWTLVLLVLWLIHAVRLEHYNARFLICSFFLIPTSNGHSYYPLLMQGWTLSFEMLFYLALALTLAFSLRRSKLIALGVIFAGLSIAARALPECGIRWLLTNTIILEFLYGVLIGELLLTVRAKASPWVCNALIGAGFIAFLCTIRLTDTDTLRFLVYGIPAAFIVLGAALRGDRSVPRPLTYLGDASYSIYLVHDFFVLAFASTMKSHPILAKIQPDAAILTLGCVTVGLSSLTYLWIETPITTYLKRRFPPAKR